MQRGSGRLKLVEDELITAGGFGQSRERGIQPLWNRVRDDITAREKEYRFA
jgi:hypothetical protein